MIRAIVYALLAGLITGYVWGCSEEKARFDSFNGATAALGRAQEKRSAEIAAWQKSSKEKADAESKRKDRARDRELADARKRLSDAGASGRLVPADPANPAGDQRLCLATEEFDRGLVTALARLQERALANAQEGQRAADVAALCRTWAEGLAHP